MTDEYIKREKLLRDIEHYHVSDGMFQHWVEIQPAADVAPVVHGYWTRKLIRNENGGCVGAKMICSNCKQDNKHDEYMLYCPNCGAKMYVEKK